MCSKPRRSDTPSLGRRRLAERISARRLRSRPACGERRRFEARRGSPVVICRPSGRICCLVPQSPFAASASSAPDGDFWDFDWLDSGNERTAVRRSSCCCTVSKAARDSHYARALMVALDGARLARRRAAFSRLQRRAEPDAARLSLGRPRGSAGDARCHPCARSGGDASSTSSAFRSAEACCSTGWGARARMRHGVDHRGGRGVRRRSTSWRRASRSARASTGSTRSNFLRTLKPKGARHGAALSPGSSTRRRSGGRERCTLSTTRSPQSLHGFAGAEDYWRRASAKPWLAGVRVPTLVLNARNDPFVPRDRCPDRTTSARTSCWSNPTKAGTSGFFPGPFPGNIDWLPRRLLDFFVHGAVVARTPRRARLPFLPRHRPFR